MTTMTPFLTAKCLHLTEKFIKWEIMSEFRDKVDPDSVSEYYSRVKEPMWLNEVRKKLRERKYQTFEQYRRDMDLIWSNAMAFNGTGTLLYLFAETACRRFHTKIVNFQKSPQEEFFHKLKKLTKRVDALTAAFWVELDHTSSDTLNRLK
jgi:hypothetical protein